jgi:predicted nucleotide-binding protein
MARQKLPQQPQGRSVSADQIKRNIERLVRIISDLEKFDPSSVKERWAPETKSIEVAIDDALTRSFGHDSTRYRRYQSAIGLDHGGLRLGGGPDPLPRVHEWLREGKADSLALIKQAVKSLEDDLADIVDDSTSSQSSTTVPAAATSDEIFIVHGHDDAAKTEVAHCIERAGLKAVILHQQANEGKTIIEKFEKHGSAAGFAVVIVTPDDVGGIDASNLQPRARQNVIGEMFWFAGRLGRDRVCALVKSGVEMPSDFAGVGYTPMDIHDGWKNKLLQELDAAGYKNIDWRKALA